MLQEAIQPNLRLSRVQVVSQIWRAQHLSNGISRVLFRAYFFSIPIMIAGLVILPVAICVDLFAQRTLIPGQFIEAGVAVVQAPLIFRPFYRVSEALGHGAWTRTIVRREQPVRYWSWTAVELLLGAAPLACAVLLLWFAVTSR